MKLDHIIKEIDKIDNIKDLFAIWEFMKGKRRELLQDECNKFFVSDIIHFKYRGKIVEGVVSRVNKTTIVAKGVDGNTYKLTPTLATLVKRHEMLKNRKK